MKYIFDCKVFCETQGFVISLDMIPRINEFLIVNDIKYKVLEVCYNISMKEYITLLLKRQ